MGRVSAQIAAVVAWFRRLVDEPRRARWLVVLAVAGGTALRIAGSTEAPFGWDLAVSYSTARDIAEGTAFPLVGAAASWGGHVPLPGYFYVVSPTFLVTTSPLAFMAWGALLCSISLVIFGRLLWERYGPRAAVFGSALAATAPWLVVSGDSAWSPKVVVPAVMLLLYSLHRVVAVERSRWVAGVPVALCLQAHIYPNVPVTLLMALAVWAVARPRVRWTWFFAGLVLSAATTLPSAIHLLTHGTAEMGTWERPLLFKPVKELLDAAYHTVGFSTAEISYEIAHGSWAHYDLFHWFRSLPGSLWSTFGDARGIYVVATVLLAWACWISAGLGAFSSKPLRARDPMAVALLVGLVGSVALTLATRRPYVPRYNIAIGFLSLLPLIWCATRRGRLAVAMWLSLLVAIPANVELASYYYRWAVPPHGTRTMVEVIRTVARVEGKKPFRLLYRWGPTAGGVSRMGRRLVGPDWHGRSGGGAKWVVLAPKHEDRYRRFLHRKSVKVWRLHRGLLVRAPSNVSAPFNVRNPSTRGPTRATPGTR